MAAAIRAQRSLHFWCAACSTGQEPYSLAILLREHFPELAGWKVALLASDLSRDALAQAREGRFKQIEVNRGLPAALLVKYFEQHGTAIDDNATCCLTSAMLSSAPRAVARRPDCVNEAICRLPSLYRIPVFAHQYVDFAPGD